MTYHGSRLFSFVSDSIGLPLDQLNFLISQIFAIIFGLLFRANLKPCPQNTLKRHLVGFLVGILLGHFCYGDQMWHLFLQGFVCYIALQFCPRKYVHLVTFVFSMGYLSALHIYRLFYDYGNYTLDISGQMMVATQKLTSLAFAYYDGMRKFEDLNEDQKTQAINDCPHMIEFLGYVFNFQGIIVGPLCYYQDYIDFITGNNILKKQIKGADGQESSIIVQPSVTVVLVKKLLLTALLAAIFFKVTLVYPISSNLLPEILEKGILYRFVYYYISASSQRVKYYLAWVLADAVNNASGLGFNGYDENGNAKWDLVSNVRILQVEMSQSMKSSFDHWNTQTQLWLRRIAYDRLPTGKTLGVFVLSAFWHGFYPGYYLTFVLCAFLVYAGRGIRRKIRPFFLKNKLIKFFYDIFTWIFAIFAVNYSAASFDLMEMEIAFKFYNSWYWCVHIVAIILVVILPGGSTKKKKPLTEEIKKE
ncbi:unnamed protein product [Brachionus calyciflorus]|uniref:Uncharacterized protein n=1 Tax=Brachionus calyciflorus TaxID=104777 RepID=A0A813M266_9BILA|nr:unnamed protein product [Brachionus calyciflorus]